MKDKITVILFILILFTFFVLSIFLEDRDVSKYERRKLVSFNDLKEDFVDNLDDYISDQFPFRDSLISLNSIFDRYVMGNKESNDVYVVDDYIIEKNYPLDMNSVNDFISKINYISSEYLSRSNVYYTIIPDKSYFLSDKYLKIDYNSLINDLNKNVNISYVDIIKLLDISDYYKTDIHIKQDCYDKVIEKFRDAFGFNYYNVIYEKKEYDDFYGASYSKVPSFFSGDSLVYLNNKVLDNAKVWHLEYGNKSVYDIDELSSTDSYNIFLSGPSSLIEIENAMLNNGKELIIFRDSFGSSFAPLLIPYYKKITLIDLRYISMDLVKNYVDFDNKDVLFAYSTLIVNNSSVLKVNVNSK